MGNASASNATGGPSRQDRLKLLLVDDHAVVRSGLENMLSARPAFVVVADAGGGEAIQVFDECSPDVVILDVMMPGMAGIEVSAHQNHEARFASPG